MSRKMKPSGIEWIGDIPEEWEVCRVKNYFSNHKIIVGDKSSVYQRLALTLSGVIKRSKEDSSGLQPEAFNGYQILKENELVFKLIDLENISTSRVGLSPFIGIVSPAYIVLEGKNVNMKYSEFYFLSMWQRCIFNQMGDDGVRSSLNSNDLLNTSFVYPPLTEQYQISSYLDTKCAHIDNIIEKTKASIEEDKKLKQAVITQAVTKGIRGDRPMKDSGIEWIGEIPEEWQLEKFKYIASVKSNLVNPNNYQDYLQVAPDNIEKGTARLLDCKTVQENGIESSNHLFYKGQIIYSKIRPILNKVIIAPFDGLCSADMYPIETIIDTHFLVYMMLSDLFLYQVKLVTENRVKMPKINQEELGRLLVCVPTISEQHEIAAYLDKKCAEIDAVITKKQQFITEMESYKKSLIFECVTGKRRCQLAK